MKRYETYKDSGIQWVGEIPSHWEIVKLRYTGTFENGLTYSTGDIVEDDGILVLRSSNIQDEHITFDDCVYVNSVPKELMVSKGDIIICSRNGSAALIGKCAIIEDDVKASFGAFMMRYRANINNKFAFYLFLSAVANYRGLFSTSTINQLTMSIINQMQVALPSDTEQKNIASYLDHKVGQIDVAIAEKEQMLEDLKNYRSAIISEAVTKGLDKNVEMKDSGIDKFPMIRSNWNTSKLKYIASIRSGSALPINNIKKDALYEVYGGNGCMGRADEYNTESPAIIIGRVGALCGNVHLIKTKKWVTDNALILNIKRDVTYEYLYYYLTAYDLNTLNSSNAQPLITGTKVLDVVTPMPSLNEQIMIANYLDDKTSMIDKTIDQITVQIVELKSYKSSLITEAVTGKIDLRNWKPKEENV